MTFTRLLAKVAAAVVVAAGVLVAPQAAHAAFPGIHEPDQSFYHGGSSAGTKVLALHGALLIVPEDTAVRMSGNLDVRSKECGAVYVKGYVDIGNGVWRNVSTRSSSPRCSTGSGWASYKILVEAPGRGIRKAEVLLADTTHGTHNLACFDRCVYYF
ncbi:hypothetical protein [Asanoa iriomotensis]|uniref:Secreted protein n=1 Tax=Asanoa iriomotensis TaxID=234613 RepID=A0ABQ4C6L9_9ACTN|nr:hypothetical protein [Asanoa iriomotensis]GIF57940.1 hypothetical protein Air01nite_40350 [Asanoa iriomotensis]